MEIIYKWGTFWGQQGRKQMAQSKKKKWQCSQTKEEKKPMYRLYCRGQYKDFPLCVFEFSKLTTTIAIKKLSGEEKCHWMQLNQGTKKHMEILTTRLPIIITNWTSEPSSFIFLPEEYIHH